MSSAPEYQIRPATAEDMETLHALIVELAVYEELEDAVETDAAGLGERIFGPNSTTEVLLAEAVGEAVGMAVYFHNFSTFLGRPGLYLEDLFVKESHRRLGIGKALLQAVAKIARERDCGRMEWTVLDWNTNAISVYEAIGAEMLTDWRIMRMDRAAIEKLAEG